MATNKELVALAVTAIPLWKEFLHQKEAEQDALLSEIRTGTESKPKQLLNNLKERFGRPTNHTNTEENPRQEPHQEASLNNQETSINNQEASQEAREDNQQVSPFDSEEEEELDSETLEKESAAAAATAAAATAAAAEEEKEEEEEEEEDDLKDLF